MSYQGRRGYRRPQPSGPRPNRLAGPCADCSQNVPPLAGILTGNRESGYTVRHRPAAWRGSPVSGGYAGGCPQEPKDKDGTPVAEGDSVRVLCSGTAGVPESGCVVAIAPDGLWATVRDESGMRASVPLKRTVRQ
jgi:hypothetical protein